MGESVVAAMNRPGVSLACAGVLLNSKVGSSRSGARRARPPKANRGGWVADLDGPRPVKAESALRLRFSSDGAALMWIERPREESVEGRGGVGSERWEKR